MFPLYDDKNKKIFFWSYKCGCTYIRDIFYNHYLKLNYKPNYIKIITLLSRYNKVDNQKLITYQKIYVCRDPYARIVSCFVDKYINGHFTFWLNLNIWIKNFFNYFSYNGNKKYYKFNFEDFIDLVYEKIVQSRINLLEFYHIAPQFSINYNNNFVLDKIYKLEDLDSSFFLKDEFNITNNVIHESKHHNNCSISENNIKDAFKLNHEQLLILKQNKRIPHYKCFYNEDIKKKVDEIYKMDIDILSKFNINYFLIDF